MTQQKKSEKYSMHHKVGKRIVACVVATSLTFSGSVIAVNASQDNDENLNTTASFNQTVEQASEQALAEQKASVQTSAVQTNTVAAESKTANASTGNSASENADENKDSASDGDSANSDKGSSDTSDSTSGDAEDKTDSSTTPSSSAEQINPGTVVDNAAAETSETPAEEAAEEEKTEEETTTEEAPPAWALSGECVLTGNLALAEESRALSSDLYAQVVAVRQAAGLPDDVEISWGEDNTADVWVIYAIAAGQTKNFPQSIEIPDQYHRDLLRSIFWSMNEVALVGENDDEAQETLSDTVATGTDAADAAATDAAATNTDATSTGARDTTTTDTAANPNEGKTIKVYRASASSLVSQVALAKEAASKTSQKAAEKTAALSTTFANLNSVFARFDKTEVSMSITDVADAGTQAAATEATDSEAATTEAASTTDATTAETSTTTEAETATTNTAETEATDAGAETADAEAGAAETPASMQTTPFEVAQAIDTTEITSKLSLATPESDNLSFLPLGLSGADDEMASLESLTSDEMVQKITKACEKSIISRLSDEEFARVETLAANTQGTRRAAVVAALCLEGKVNYFYGGKFHSVGWNNAWGTKAVVTGDETLAGGSIRSYGLDCSGFVCWAFINAAGSVTSALPLIGEGTSEQWNNSKAIEMKDALPGDLVFKAGPEVTGANNHVGIVVSNDNGKLTVVHCAGSANNVIVTDASAFSYARSPYLYGN